MLRLNLRILILILFAFTGRAQEVFKFEYVTVNDGLAHSDAVDVLQDQQGFIWIATNNGIDRYDGYELKNYLIPNANINGLYNNRISDIYVSEDGTIRAASEEQGVFFYDTSSDSFKSLDEKTKNADWKKLLRSISPRTLSTYKSEILFIGTRTQGVLGVTLNTNGEITNVQQIQLTKVQSLLTNRKKVREYFQKQILVEPKEAVIPDADRAFIENAMEIIEKNLTNEQFSVQLLIQKSNMSQSAFYRKLKNITGQSVVEFIRDVRLKRAAQLLSSGQYRVMEVMNQVGMEDYKRFKTAFQKLYNELPSEYAKTQNKKRDSSSKNR